MVRVRANKSVYGVSTWTFPAFRFLSMLQQRMTWLSQRQNVLSQNVANADTPGYAAHDLKPLDFATGAEERRSRQQFLRRADDDRSAPHRASTQRHGGFDDHEYARHRVQSDRQFRVARTGNDQGRRHPGAIPGRHQSLCQGDEHDADRHRQRPVKEKRRWISPHR